MTKTNDGNSLTDITVTITKSSIAGLLTSFNIDPTNVKKENGNAVYEFTKELNPGETLNVKAKTSYYLPILILLLLVAAVWIFVYVTTPQIKIVKKAVKVKTKSGVFATKIVLSAANNGKNEVTDLKIVDHFPAFTELVPGKFGTISPTEIRKKTLIWSFDRLSVGEEIMLSYIIYSKISIIGQLDIPVTFASYMDMKGSIKESRSNRLYVLAQDAPEQSASQLIE